MWRVLPALLLGAALAGCESMNWAAQAAWGQIGLLGRRAPLERVIARASTPEDLRSRLVLIGELRAFAREDLAMHDVRGFDSYVDTGREHAVWNVVASGEFSVEPVRWCFPVAGCVSYRGYFRRASAERYATRLAARGLDTHVYGVAAYSTLGWFDDPVLDTWVMRDEPALAALVFHELAHQLVYVPDDTALSESFARVVEREGVRRWLLLRGSRAEYEDYLRAQRIESGFNSLLDATRTRLAALYGSGLPPAQMRERKQREFERLRAEYARASAAWPPGPRYDAWMRAPLNNARLVSVANYERWIVALESLLREQHGDLAAFHVAVGELARLAPAVREARLLALEGAATMR